jgi:phosphatidylinositol-3,4,5-trisphosphate 3-phosphatase/dual-specificity protein phosphatase PTEN
MAAQIDVGDKGASQSWGNFRIVSVQTRLKNLVSKEKRRFKDEKYDLDLTYINSRIIAMGFPASGSEATYRNDADDVYNFFEERHKDHYKFYNLCSERAYPPERFHGRVAHFPFDDHNPPPLGMFYYFCKDVEDWLAQDEKNVAAIHCKAGKGRTGVMITAFLMFCKDWEEPEEAMQFYGFARTNNQKGITIPAQRTFIYYWHEILKRTAVHESPLADERRSSIMGGEGSAAHDATVKAQILAAADEHLKEGGEEDDSESDPETESTDIDPSVVEQIAQLDALKSAGHLSEVEYDEAKKHVIASQAANAAKSKSKKKSKRGSNTRSSGAAADEDSPDEEEEEEDDTSVASSSSMFKKFGFGSKKKGLQKVPDKCVAKEENSLMDRSWNDRNRAEPPLRGQIPDPVLKSITHMRIRTTPKGGYEPLFKIFTGGVTYDSKDNCVTEFVDKQAVIEIPCPEMPVIDEVFVILYRAGGTFGKKKKIAQFWFHTAFVENNKIVIKKKNMDKAIKDKKHKKYSADFCIEFEFKDTPNAPDPRRQFVPKKCAIMG